MAYDNTNFYGDLIVSEYDDKGNFMTPPTPTGYYVYHILGDGFDLMSEMCTQFMNDFSILTASTKGLDNFWGVSYNMPRPLLYKGQKAEYLFEDLTGDTSKYIYDSRCNVTSSNNEITVTWVSGAYIFWANKGDRSTEFDYTGDFTVEFDLLSNGNNATIQIYDNSASTYYTKSLNQLNGMNAGHFKIVKDGQVFKTFVDGVEKTAHQVNSNITGACRVGFRMNTPSPIQFRNFKIYRGEYKERYLTDDEYRIYLYLRNCRLMTREDIEINMNKCFAVENENSQYHIFFSTETNYLSVVNHLNYNSKTTEESNLAKNDEDTSLNFITNFANDEDTLLIDSGLSEVEEVIEVINVPSPNEYDPAFLELLENYISVKGNLKIKEYSI